MFTKTIKFINRHRLMLLVAVLTLATHGINLWGFPKWLGDEGIYTSQAWYLVEFGKLSPYSYWYDHSPIGWLQIGLWQKLTGGPFAFGPSLFSTRIFMLAVATLTNLIVFKLTQTITKSRKLALLASIIFAASPLTIYCHRQVLLDNIQTLWFVFAVFSLYQSRCHLGWTIASGISLGLAFLSKETTLVAFPALICLLFYTTKTASNRTVSRVVWVISSLFPITIFPLLALLKGEFFPAGWTPGTPHVSLLETVLFQITRGNEYRPWEIGSFLRHNLPIWFFKDPLLFTLGVWSTLINLTQFKNHPGKGFIGLLSLSYMAFLARGGLTLEFYIIPLLSIWPISIALSLSTIKSMTLPRLKIGNPATLAIFALILILFVGMDTRTYTYSATANQLASLKYAKTVLTPTTSLVVDDSVLLDLMLNPDGTKIAYPLVDWYSKVNSDPAIRNQKYANDWRNINYILVNEYILSEMDSGTLPFLSEAFSASQPVKLFPKATPPTRSLLPMPEDIAPYAMDIALYQVQPGSSAMGNLISHETNRQ